MDQLNMAVGLLLSFLICLHLAESTPVANYIPPVVVTPPTNTTTITNTTTPSTNVTTISNPTNITVVCGGSSPSCGPTTVTCGNCNCSCGTTGTGSSPTGTDTSSLLAGLVQLLLTVLGIGCDETTSVTPGLPDLSDPTSIVDSVLAWSA